MTRRILLLTFILIIFLRYDSLSQFTELTFSPEVIFSNIETHSSARAISLEDLNTWKYYGGLRVGTNYDLWHDTLKIKLNLFYNERKALEFFTFSNSASAIRKLTLGAVPTSPQHPLFENDLYLHLPNFKYLHLELLPTFILRRKWIYEIGTGISGGILLNRSQITFKKEDFPWAEESFEPKGTFFGEVQYYLYDITWILYVGTYYDLSSKWSIGANARFTHSLVNLNDSVDFRDSRFYKYWWITLTGAIQIVYKI